jgi:anti-sigma regulatory factor (Ser/Thr protein kinase)
MNQRMNDQALIRFLHARVPPAFSSRENELLSCRQLARDAMNGQVRWMAVRGPQGSGRSELLKQAVIDLRHRDFDILPIYIDLGNRMRDLSCDGSPLSEDIVLASLNRLILRQVLSATSRIELMDPFWLEADTASLAGLCHGAGLGNLAVYLNQPSAFHSRTSVWESLFQLLNRLDRLKPLLLIDGTGHTSEMTGCLSSLLVAAEHAECPALFESPLSCGIPQLHIRGLQAIDLTPLDMDAAFDLVQRHCDQLGLKTSPDDINPILMRLGPWPGWLHEYMAVMKKPEPGTPAVRMIEQAYVDLVGRSFWSRHFRGDLDRLVSCQEQHRVVRMLLAAARSQHALSIDEIATMLGGAGSISPNLMDGLAELGLIHRVGAHWTGPQEQVLKDWVELIHLESESRQGIDSACLDLLGRLLTRPAEDGSREGSVVVQVQNIFGRFQGQLLPEVIFKFGDYYEAVGRLDADERCEVLMKSSRRRKVPEMIGHASWDVDLGNGESLRLIYSRGYRDGVHQRSHEEIWIAVDLTVSRSITTPELQDALDAMQHLENQLGPGRYFRWFIINEGASVEAFERLQREGYYCSNCEQLGMLGHLLAQVGSTPDKEAVPAGRPVDKHEDVGRVTHDDSGDRSAGPVDGPDHPSPAVPVGAEIVRIENPPYGMVHEQFWPNEAASAIEAGDPGPTQCMKIPARADHEYKAARMADQFARDNGFDPVVAGRIGTAVLEGVLNAIEHSSDPGVDINIRMHAGKELMEIVIENEGKPIAMTMVPGSEPGAKIQADPKRGWGIALMARFMDDINYLPMERGTRLRLTKKRSTQNSLIGTTGRDGGQGSAHTDDRDIFPGMSS